jgi:AraC-like DNA-binding protein
MPNSRPDDWAASVIAKCQRLAGDLAADDDYDEVRERIDALASSLPSPPTRRHNLVLAPLLLDTAFRITDLLHRRVAPPAPCPCRAIDEATIRAFLNWREQNATWLFARWAAAFLRAYETHHPQTPASRVSRIIRREPQRAWTLASGARAAGVSTQGLARAFVREHGMNVRTYVHTCRLRAALDQWSPGVKIEALALEAGYRSRKDFYRVIRQLLQTTPAAVRRLSASERDALQRRLRTRLLGA